MTTASRVQGFLGNKPIDIALERLLEVFQRGLQDKVLFVKYEDLLIDPESTMSKIYEYIDEPEFKHDFKNLVKKVEESDEMFGIFGCHKIDASLKKFKPHDWSDVYDDNISDMINKAAPWYREVLDYH